jgi:hypothetical protein
MNSLRTATLPAVGLLAAIALTGCSLLSPSTPSEPDPVETTQAPSITADDLSDTSWEGTDSEGTDTAFILHASGSTAVTFSGNDYDDPGDTWKLDGSTLTIVIRNVEKVGDATYTGTVADPAGPIDLTLTFSDVDETRTLTITQTAG